MPYLECERETTLAIEDVGTEDFTNVGKMLVGRQVLVLADNYFKIAWGLDPDTHKVLWERRCRTPDDVRNHKVIVTSGCQLVRALFDDDVIVTGSAEIARLDGKTGQLKWSRDVDDGFFGGGGWVALADGMGCAVYYSLDEATGGLRGPNRSIVFRLASGEPCDTALSHLPFWLALDSPARFLYREPPPVDCPDLYYGVRTGEIVKDYPFSLGALAADTGASLWCTNLGTMSRSQIPYVYIAQQPLGACQFKRKTDTATFTEIAWLDLDSGQVLRTDKMDVHPYKAIGLVAASSRQEHPSAADLLAQARVLTVEGRKLLFLDPAKPEEPVWATDLTDVLPPALQRDTGVFWHFDVWSFPFGVINARLSEPVESLLLVVDLRDGSLWRTASARNHTWVLDGERNVLYVLAGQRLRRYRLPEDSRSREPVLKESEAEQPPSADP